MRRKVCNPSHGSISQSGRMVAIVALLLSFGSCNCKDLQPDEDTTSCTNLLPGLQKLQRGVDVTKLDLLPLKYNGGDGFKHPVIDFNCAKGKTRRIGGFQYNVPDEVTSIMNIPGGFLKLEVNILKKPSDVLKMISANIDIDAKMKGFFSASVSYKKIFDTFYNESRNIEHIVSHQSTSRADLIPRFVLRLGKYATMFVNDHLPSEFGTNPEKYFEFIKIFGTHYFSNVKFGGSFQLYIETMKSYYQGKTDEEVKVEASNTFFNLLNVIGGVSPTTKKVDTRFTASSNQLIRYFGGNVSLLNSGGIARWQPSVARNPWVFGGHLVPLSELIVDNSKKESMKKATQMYIDLTYLDFLSDILHWASIKYPLSHKRIAEYMNQIQALKALNASDHNAVMDLDERIETELEIPSWFYQHVELCHRWRPDYFISQCGGGVARNLCAKIGSMTEYYLDNTDWRWGGCRMQWGIKKPGKMTEPWLKQMQICYRWWPDGNVNQCGGGAPRHMCAPVNQYTIEYRDSTNWRGGGCWMQWSLTVPEEAPIWLHNTKLCFQWYADGNGGQCGGGVDKLLCATANNWTTPYQDDTDWRGGGCRVRWGIIPS